MMKTILSLPMRMNPPGENPSNVLNGAGSIEVQLADPDGTFAPWPGDGSRGPSRCERRAVPQTALLEQTAVGERELPFDALGVPGVVSAFGHIAAAMGERMCTDALLHPYTADGSAYMEYGRDRGVYADLPLQDILDAFRETYGTDMFLPETQHTADAFTAPA